MLTSGKGDIPLYMQVKDLLISRISKGDWLPGSVIPSEINLSRELSVSQGTVRKAITELVESNVLTRKQGLGTFVSQHDYERALFHFFHIVDDKGHKVLPDSKVLSCRKRKANKLEVRRLSLESGTEIIRIERVRSISSLPAMAETISLPAQLFEGLATHTHVRLPNTLYEYYEKQFGITIHRSHERLRAISATRRDAGLLNIAPAAPLLEIERTAFTLDGLPVELRVSRCLTRNLHYENTVF